MKLELIKMPHTTGRDEHRRYRRHLIVLNDFIMEDIKEADYPFMKRNSYGYEKMVEEKIEKFEKALNIKALRIRGAE